MCNTSIRHCCLDSARQTDAAFCVTCGEPILRCGNHPACGGLLPAEQICPVCFAPELNWLSDSEKVSVGQAAHLKLELANRSPSTSNLIVKQACFRVATGEWSPIELPWDHVDQGQAKPLRFNTQPLHTGGEQGIEIVLILAARHGFREEVYAFCANLTINVEDKQDVVVQQNIHYAADAPQTGATIYAPVRVQSDSHHRQPTPQSPVKVLELHRASRYEKQFGVRKSDSSNVGPMTFIEYRDTRTGLQVSIPRFAQRRSQMVFGRTRSKEEGGTNDVRLLFHQADGSVNEAASLQISREHFCLYAEQGDLKLRALSAQGVRLDGSLVFPGNVQTIRHGSRVELEIGRARITLLIDLVDNNLVDSESDGGQVIIRRVN